MHYELHLSSQPSERNSLKQAVAQITLSVEGGEGHTCNLNQTYF